MTERWLARVSEPLATVVTEDSPAPQRLKHWLDSLLSPFSFCCAPSIVQELISADKYLDVVLRMAFWTNE